MLFLPNSDAKQSAIYFYIQGNDYTKETYPYTEAFNQSFSGGFSGLVQQEIREYRSMAYTSYGQSIFPRVENKKAYFGGYIGTQGGKTMDAIEVYVDLLTNMPQYPDRLADIKSFLKETASVERPPFRYASLIYERWKQRGYSLSPAETHQKAIEDLTFDDIVAFYNDNIKGRPLVIAIAGNPKLIDEKALAKYGKVIKLTNSKVFSDR